MNRQVPVGEALMADQAYDRLIEALREGTLGAGQFVSMPGLVGDDRPAAGGDARGGKAG